MSHISETLDLVAQLRSEVCVLLRINSKNYDELFFESGCRYLEEKYDSDTAKLLRSHKLFWTWWKVEYTIKDREFISRTRQSISKRTQDFYMNVHVNMNYKPGTNITRTIIKEWAKNGTHN